MNASRLGGLLIAAAASLSPAASAEVRELATGGFTVEQDVVVPGSPEGVWDLFTGDVSPWWDHSFSGNPHRLYIEARPGGGFYEIFDEAGNGAKHAEVIYADRGKILTMRGPLGFSGKALDMVHQFRFEAEGDSTRIRLTIHGVGQMEEGWGEAVDGVWKHFLVERFKPYVERGGGAERE